MSSSLQRAPAGAITRRSASARSLVVSPHLVDVGVAGFSIQKAWHAALGWSALYPPFLVLFLSSIPESVKALVAG